MYECSIQYENAYLALGKKAPAPGNCFPYVPKSDWTTDDGKFVKQYCSKISLGILIKRKNCF